MNIRNFEVIVDDLEKNPHCLHGPTLIFCKNGEKTKKYYACSACRDRKFCGFHFPINEKKKILIKSCNFWKEQQKKILSAINETRPQEKLNEILSILEKKRNYVEKIAFVNSEGNTKFHISYCYTCSCLFKKHEYKKHVKCKVLSNLTYYQLTHPTSFIIPKTNSKTHAQYFFSETTVKDIVLLLLRLKITKVLSIGVPKIHEYVLNNCKNKIKSLLLDFDNSYFNFYKKNQFIWYNMFNNYIFDEKQEEVLQKFLQSGRIIVLMDPPFGGRVESLARTLIMLNKTYKVHRNIHEKGKLKLNAFWFFPYFMEQHIKNCLFDFNMFDYKVNYENHSSFTDSGNKKRKFGSPVRIFTNIPLSRLNLKGVSGYKFCGTCGYWVSNENKHCEECNACTSKNGRTYIHCSECTKCVKPSYKHCNACSRCCLPNHICGKFQPDVNCYHCHQPGHKKRECVFLIKNTKRHLSAPEIVNKKRKVNMEI